MKDQLLIIDLANEEDRRLKKSFELVGSVYGVVSDLANLYEGLARFLRFTALEKGTPAFAAGLNGNLALFCRKQLTTSVLTVLRGHLVDANLHLRKAIEICAYANKIAKHPHLAVVWYEAANGSDQFELHRQKFDKLFPDDDPQLSQLYDRFDQCSKMMHASPYGVAHYLSAKRDVGDEGIRGFFDTEHEMPMLIHFYSIVGAHRLIVRVFERILTPFMGDSKKEWRRQAKPAQERFEAIVRAASLPARVSRNLETLNRRRLQH